MPFLLAVAIAAVILLDPVLPIAAKSILYAVSLSIKSCIIFLLPIIIFGLLFKAAVQLANRATGVIVLILTSICVSNFFSTFLSRFVGMWVYQRDLSLAIPRSLDNLEPFFSFQLPKIIANDKAMLFGLLIGILLSLFRIGFARQIAEKLDWAVGKILSLITYLVPLFIMGFIVKLHHDGLMGMIVKDYALIFVVIALALSVYISLIYLVSNRFNVKAALQSFKNMVPAALTGFGSMSSAAAMPLTIMATEKNCDQPELARSIIPATVNTHLIGDCFAIPIFAFAVLKTFGIMEPSLAAYLSFAFYFVLAKFSVAAVPGGGILVMLPILESHLGFNAEMMSLITALYVLFDPVITCANVVGNGGFALFFDKVLLRRKQ